MCAYHWTFSVTTDITIPSPALPSLVTGSCSSLHSLLQRIPQFPQSCISEWALLGTSAFAGWPLVLSQSSWAIDLVDSGPAGISLGCQKTLLWAKPTSSNGILSYGCWWYMLLLKVILFFLTILPPSVLAIFLVLRYKPLKLWRWGSLYSECYYHQKQPSLWWSRLVL